MALKEYAARRDFKKTSEPRARKGASRKIFVVQKHRATRLHYDFRLGMGGVLKSWAVPKGPSMNPAEKRLAVQTEDHPYAYRTFEGTVPKGQYGAGTVEIWDRGTYGNLGGSIRHGELTFTLHGKKLSGAFALVRMRGKNWLLIKQKGS